MRSLVLLLVSILMPTAVAAEPTITLPFELRDGRAFVQARIGDQTLTLLVDTGGVNVLSQAAADRLALGRDEGLSRGAGAPAVRAPRVELGSYAVTDQVFFVLDLGRLPEVEGAAFDGVLGLEAFEHEVITLDYSRQQITLTDPAAFVAPPTAAKIHYDLDERRPLIAAKVDGLAGSFAIDVGARGPLTLRGAFVGDNELLDRYHHGHETVVGWGIGGPAQGYPTRVGALAIGAIVVPQVVAFLQTDERRGQGVRNIAGSIGGRLLARFTVTLDFARHDLYLEPTAALAVPDAYDRSGMWLNTEGEDLIIDALQANGPGARSQLQLHDRIINLDGVPVTQLTLVTARRMLAESPVGTRLKITARRDGKVIYATVILADLVP